MINLIKNEFNKNFSKKQYLLLIFIIIILSLIYKYSHTIESFINTLHFIPPFIGIIISIYSSSIISKEYSSGTFKHYLTKPTKRWKIIISKIFYLFLLTIYYQLLTIFIYFLIILLTNNIEKINELLTIIKTFFKYSSPIYFIIFFSTYLSTILNNSKITSTISTILFITSMTISELLFTIKWTFIEYTFLPYMDLSIFSDLDNIKMINDIYNINLNIKTGNIILIIYSIIFLILTLVIFKNKDIHN